MTGLTETEHVVRALEAGGVDYLTKPINIDELRESVLRRADEVPDMDLESLDD